MLYNISDTIVAIATAKGNSGIGIVRISGILALTILRKLVKKKVLKKINYVSFFCKNNFLIDKGLALIFKCPKSYTGEDVVELHVHGNDLILDSIVLRSIELGARLAYNGEFSFRAYLNNKIDLIQAESINAIIKSGSLYSNKFIFKSLFGEFSNKIKIVLYKLKELKLELEAAIEFPEHIVFDFDKFFFEINSIYSYYCDFFDYICLDNLSLEYLNIVILGNVNVGKSSLFNFLLNTDRAIVSEHPGTTRDFIDSLFFIKGLKFKLIDTAGFNSFTTDFLEKISIERSLLQAKNANILIIVVDVREEFDLLTSSIYKYILDNCANRFKLILVRNKIDLTEKNKSIFFHEEYVEIFMSVKSRDGIDLLVNELVNICTSLNDKFYLATKRQLDLLFNIKKNFDSILNFSDSYASLDNYSLNINDIIHSFSNLLGINTSEDVLSEIFSNFCVGK